ncbi:MAG: ATP-binding protein [Bacteroidales bacterium]|nr:ATP-binding protein [Bacteroidales bacterium]
MEYIEREVDIKLNEWSLSDKRMPLLIRGARQVGKTSSVRHLGERFKYFVEIDMNEHRELHELFSQMLTPQEICLQLSYAVNIPIEAGETLLFIDEIQSCPEAINKLRYFYEQYPELHLIAAGSLLEFVLADIPSFGVGRIRSLFMYPLNFEEFLHANGEDLLITAYQNASPEKPLSKIVHDKILQRFSSFILMGGMPRVVQEYVETKDLRKCQLVLNDLVVSYKDDFKKYRKRIPEERLATVLESVARQHSGRFVYSNVNDDLSLSQVKITLELLIKAGLVYPVVHSAVNGIPLGAETNERYQRMALFDTGILMRMLGLNLAELFVQGIENLTNKGSLAEVFVANELVKNSSCFEPPQLFCWHREKKDSQAEVDFVVQKGYDIIPIEVKSGTRGSMQSLRIFMEEKKSQYGIRTSLENFSSYDNIKVYPLYAISNLIRQ